MFFDPNWFIIMLPALLLGFWAQAKVKSAYAKYSRVPSAARMTGGQAARYLLDRAGLADIAIEPTPGNLTDHYDPRRRVLRLSQGVYGSDSLAALGIAAHETGHALQDQAGYAPMRFRAQLVPVANLGSSLLFPLLIVGFLFQSGFFIDLGIILFSAAVLFQLVTLPVEFNASSRAMALLENTGTLHTTELNGARRVLSAAAWTYVAATLAAVLQLVYLLTLRRD